MHDHNLASVTHGVIGNCEGGEPVSTFYPHLEMNARWKERSGNLLHVALDPGFTRQSPDAPMTLDLSASATALRDAHEALLPLGVEVGIENWNIDPAPPPEYYSELREAAGVNIGALLDLGHLNIAEKSGLLGKRSLGETIEAISIPVIEVHIHDNDGITDQHLPIGHGQADFATMLGALQRSGFDGVLTVEAVPRRLDTEMTCDEQLRHIQQSLDMTRQIVG